MKDNVSKFHSDDDYLARYYPHLAPVAAGIEHAIASIEEFNDGHGVISITLKKGVIQFYETQARYYPSKQDNKIS